MDYIQKLPFILGVSSAILTAIISYLTGTANSHTYARVAVALITFYILGIVIRGVLMSIHNDIKSRKEQEEKADAMSEANGNKTGSSNDIKTANVNKPTNANKPNVNKTTNANKSANVNKPNSEAIKSKLDLAAGEDEEFLPLAVSHLMKNEQQMKK